MNTFLIALLCLLSIAVVFQLVRISNFLDRINQLNFSIPSPKDNDLQGKLMFIFGVVYVLFYFWAQSQWGASVLPRSASAEGETYDFIMLLNWLVIIPVFLLVIPVTFYFCYRYRGNGDRKAYFYHHNNKLELIWTILPTVTFATIIIIGLFAWSDIMYVSEEEEQEAVVIEIYAKQFSWTARYAGEDNVLGRANVRFVGGKNIVGVDPKDIYASDDIVVSNELHLPVGRRVVFKFRSQDVIHSAYMPHFRAQMNCVPGMVTQFSFTPTVTTAQMREFPEVIRKVDRVNKYIIARGDDPWEYDYLLLCNKICENAHYNMQMKIIVESPEKYEQWISKQTKFQEVVKS